MKEVTIMAIDDNALGEVYGGTKENSVNVSEDSSLNNGSNPKVVAECPKCHKIVQHTVYSGGRLCCSNCGNVYFG